MQLTISDVFKQFGSVEALRGASFDAEPGEFFALLGPSGAGKTTLLRIIAGIEQADRGRVLLDGRDVADIPVRGRDTAMVFQTFALYPHLSTFENLAYPLARGASRQPKKSRNASARSRKCCGCRMRLSRKPNTLSGGEQQRCAIGRALIRRPKLLLLDEPLTNLDAKLRHDTRAEFKRLHRELGETTIIYATPDQIEALSMGQRIGVLQRRPHRADRPAANALFRAARRIRRFAGRRSADQSCIRRRCGTSGRRRRFELPFVDIDAAPWTDRST